MQKMLRKADMLASAVQCVCCVVSDNLDVMDCADADVDVAGAGSVVCFQQPIVCRRTPINHTQRVMLMH